MFEKIKGGLLLIVVASILYIAYGIYDSFSVAHQKDLAFQKLPAHIAYAKTTLKEMKAKSTPTDYLKKIAISYTRDEKIDPNYATTLYNCLGNLVYDKNEDFTIDKMLEWCRIDYDQNKTDPYYNTAELMSDFSLWDGSYTPLENGVKQALDDPSSYEHVKTLYSLVYYGAKRPHMNLKMTYRAKNQYGALVKATIEVKIDAVTKDMYDVH